MTLEKPFIGDFKLGQHFGENFNSYYQSEGLLGHAGLDFPMPNGTPIIAACDGTVVYVSKDINKGEGVSIRSKDTFQSNGLDCKFSCIYWHLQDGSIKVKVGDQVTTGQLLGLSNNTGQTTGPHLHFGLFPLSVDGSHELFLNNGYKGAVDPLPYLNLSTSPTAPLVQFKHAWAIPIQRVKDFQAKHGLVADGVVGPKTQFVIDGII